MSRVSAASSSPRGASADPRRPDRRRAGAAWRRLLAWTGWLALPGWLPSIVHAGASLPSSTSAAPASLRWCDAGSRLDTASQDRLLRFADIARGELSASGARIALVARSGLDLSRFGVRYSHGGISLRESENGAWSVRQLYYACEEGRPRLFDQGLGGFVSGTDDPTLGYLSVLLLDDGAEARALEAAALDRRRALALVAGRYSANAHPYGLRYQNCNQWLIELIATAWSGDAGRREPAPADGEAARARAQDWLRAAGYQPEAVQVDSHLTKFAAGFVPWIHLDDHPPDDRLGLSFRVSMPASIEAFVRARIPAARRIELCHGGHGVVVRHDGPPIASGCVPGPGDRVVPL